MPIRIIPSAAIIFPNILMNTFDTKIYCEMLASANPENLKNIELDRSLMTGLEFGKYANHLEAALGSALKLDYDKEITPESFNFYLRVKLDWFRM